MKISSQGLEYRMMNEGDVGELFPLHSDPEVMKFIREPNTKIEETQAWVERFLGYMNRHPQLGCRHYFVLWSTKELTGYFKKVI